MSLLTRPVEHLSKTFQFNLIIYVVSTGKMHGASTVVDFKKKGNVPCTLTHEKAGARHPRQDAIFFFKKEN